MSLLNNFIALADPTRLRILNILGRLSTIGASSSQIAETLQVKLGVASHHLKLLQEKGLVLRTQSGKFAVYKIDLDRFRQLRQDLINLEQGTFSDESLRY